MPVNVRRITLESIASLCIALAMALVLAHVAFAGLPDNRAYEMVSPVEKGGNVYMPDLALPDAGGEHVVVDGGVSNSPLSSGSSWMAETRTPTGWQGVQVGPRPGPETFYLEQRETGVVAVSADFSRFAFQTFMSLEPRDSGTSSDVYVRNGPAGPFEWVTGPPAPTIKNEGAPVGCVSPLLCIDNSVEFAGASSDLSDVVWSQPAPILTPPESLPQSPPDTHAHGDEVYESLGGAGGIDQLVGLIPVQGEAECDPSRGDCVVPPCGAAMGNATLEGGYNDEGFAPTLGAVSKSGSQVIFASPDPNTEGSPECSPAEIYIKDGSTRVIRASASQKPGGDPNGPHRKTYAGSAEEGGKITTVYFTSSEELTEDANTGAVDQGNDLYSYSLGTGRLTDLTPDGKSSDSNGAGVLEFIGAATDGSRVYFTASGALAPGATSGQPNLYVYNTISGQTNFIAPGQGIKGPNAGLGFKHASPAFEENSTSDVTPDGEHLVIASRERLTAYNNYGPDCVIGFGGARSAGLCNEIYLYDAPTGNLVCTSCSPTGAPPAGGARLTKEEYTEGGSFFNSNAGTLPRPQVVSDDGTRVFFDSPDQLTIEAPKPTTTQAVGTLTARGEFEPNVYEYEDGQVHLIATGAALLGTTPSGGDVFFDTYSQLAPQDRDGSPDVYDARVDGGFPALAPAACSGTSCQGTPATPPIFATPSSVTFNGVGNFPSSTVPSLTKSKTKPRVKPAKCKKGYVRKKSKCVRAAKAEKQRHSEHGKGRK